MSLLCISKIHFAYNETAKTFGEGISGTHAYYGNNLVSATAVIPKIWPH